MKNSYVIEKCHKKEKVKGCFAKRLLSYCVQCVLLLFRLFFYFYFLLLWEKGLQYFSISKKDFVKGKILNFIFSLYTRSNNMCAISKNIFSIIQLNIILRRYKLCVFFHLFKKYFAIPFFVFCSGLTFEFMCSCVVIYIFCWNRFLFYKTNHKSTIAAVKMYFMNFL